MSMEPTAGRREYDSDHVDPATKNYVEDRLRDTRHELRNDITVLASAQAASALQATKEHGEVRSDIQGLRAEVSALRRDVGELTPLRESVEGLRHRDEIDQARAETSKQMLAELQKQRTQFRNFMIAIAGLVVAAAGVVVAVVH